MKPRSWLSLSALSSFIAISAHASQQTQADAPSWEVGADGFSWIVYGGLFGLLLSTVVLLAIWFREWQKNKLW
tara:strand:- start:2286 stop:2504 length:219 start_codon:yes stop_codon:yes gene_type:complete